MAQQTVLVVDDERDIRELLAITLGRMDLAVETAATVNDAKKMLGDAHYDLCFTDMRLPDGTGQELIELIAREHPETPVAMMTAYGNVEAAVNALKAGAFDFVSKPVDIHMLRRLVQTALRASQPAESAGDAEVPTGRLIGNSPVMREVRARIAKFARSQAPIHISGESGVGKELVARSIHELGPRASGPFVPVNCGAIPSELMESEFFGHKKGSFTGAMTDKEGLFQTANGGTLFLDEVAELPIHMQVKLLRVIQEKAVRPIGGRSEVPVDVRILSATHKDLGHLVHAGQFRQDLYYRINVIELRVPPLRERDGDIEVLARHVLARLAEQAGVPVPRLQPATLQALNGYDFPGNVRELENVLERAIALCEGGVIEPADLMLEPSAAQANIPAAPATSPTPIAEEAGDAGSTTDPGADADGHADRDRDSDSDPDSDAHAEQAEPSPEAETEALAEPESPPEPAAAPPNPVSTGDVGLDDYISSIERDAITKALKDTHNNKTAAARKLGITFRALRYKLKKLGID